MRSTTCATIASAYLGAPLTPADVVWTYSGVRPLYDDGSADPSAVTRDYVLKLDRGDGGQAPVLSIFGGKITTYRRLAEAALAELAPFFPAMGRAMDARASRCLAATSRAAISPRTDANSPRAIPQIPAAGAAKRCCTATERARRACSATRGRRPTRRRISAHTLYAAGSGLFRRAGMGARRRGRALAPYQVRAAPERGATRSGVEVSARAVRLPVTARAMLPLGALPASVSQRDGGVLTDIDDTLSTHGRITALAYAAMERLRAAGLLVIPVTGRPAGWCDHIARMWPVDAVVGENGALYMRHDARARKLTTCFATPPDERRAQRERLATHRHEDPARGARLRGRVGPALSRERPGDRLLRGRAAAVRGQRRAHRRADARRRPHRQGLVDPCQRLVRRLRQADDDAQTAGRRVRRRSRSGAGALRVRRRFPERRADVRVFPVFGRRGQRARVWRLRRECRRSTSPSASRARDSPRSRNSCSARTRKGWRATSSPWSSTRGWTGRSP